MTPEQHAAKIRELEAPMAAAYLAEVRAVESEATVAEVERLLREGDSEGLVAYLSLYVAVPNSLIPHSSPFLFDCLSIYLARIYSLRDSLIAP